MTGLGTWQNTGDPLQAHHAERLPTWRRVKPSRTVKMTFPFAQLPDSSTRRDTQTPCQGTRRALWGIRGFGDGWARGTCVGSPNGVTGGIFPLCFFTGEEGQQRGGQTDRGGRGDEGAGLPSPSRSRGSPGCCPGSVRFSGIDRRFHSGHRLPRGVCRKSLDRPG